MTQRTMWKSQVRRYKDVRPVGLVVAVFKSLPEGRRHIVNNVTYLICGDRCLVQLKVVPLRSEKSVYAPHGLSEVFPKLLWKQFQCSSA